MLLNVWRGVMLKGVAQSLRPPECRSYAWHGRLTFGVLMLGEKQTREGLF